jgi:hypothetical protein
MAERSVPQWFSLCESATPEVMKRIADAVTTLSLSLQVKNLPLQAHWFVLDSLFLANRANREGMHANALALTRQCIEAISVIELGLSKHTDSEAMLLKWESDELTPGALRKWLSEHVWAAYGSGLWSEPWSDFMSKFARAVQPYAHYSSQLAKWQLRLHVQIESGGSPTLLVEYSPRAYDAQKATRITLFHAIVAFTLGRIWIAHSKVPDPSFDALMNRLRVAIGASMYLDGHQTDWDQQFWSIVWSSKDGTILE